MFGNCFFPLFSAFKNNFLFLKQKSLFDNLRVCGKHVFDFKNTRKLFFFSLYSQNQVSKNKKQKLLSNITLYFRKIVLTNQPINNLSFSMNFHNLNFKMSNSTVINCFIIFLQTVVVANFLLILI